MCPVSGQAVAGDVSGFRTSRGRGRVRFPDKGRGPAGAGGGPNGSRGARDRKPGARGVGVRARAGVGVRARAGGRSSGGVFVGRAPPVVGVGVACRCRGRAGVGVAGWFRSSGAGRCRSSGRFGGAPRCVAAPDSPRESIPGSHTDTPRGVRRVVFAAWCPVSGQRHGTPPLGTVRFPDTARHRHGTGTAPATAPARHRAVGVGHGTAPPICRPGVGPGAARARCRVIRGAGRLVARAIELGACQA